MKETWAKNVNIFVVSLGFFLSFMAFYTMGNIQVNSTHAKRSHATLSMPVCHMHNKTNFHVHQTVVIEAAQDPESSGYIKDFKGSGYIALCITYLVSGLADWIVPSLRALVGLKATLIIGATAFLVYIASFYFLSTGLLYATAAVAGVGNAFLTVSQVTPIELVTFKLHLPDAASSSCRGHQWL